MNANKMPIFILGLILLVVVNLAGALLLNKTYRHANQIDRNLMLQGEQIIRSVVISLESKNSTHSREELSLVAQQLLEVENIESSLFIDGDGKIVAQSGTRIPPALVNNFKRTETYGIRQNNLYFLSLPIIESDYGSGSLTQAALPQGHIILALNTAKADQQRDLLRYYFFSGTIFLGCLDLILLISAISYYRRLNAYRNAPPEIQQQFAKGYRQLKQSIEMQQRAIEKARHEALKTSEIKSQFIANMSHEIRTPLNAILGFTDLLLKSKLDHRQKDFLLTIRKSSLGLLQIINDILDFSKIEAGKVSLDEISIDLRETVEDVLTVLAPSAHEKRLELVSIFAPDLPNQVIADPLRLKQILTNLVSNSIKFTDSGSIAVRINIEAKNSDNATFKISVSDTGIGIAREKQERLFQAFSQVDTSTTREFGGSGLGLVIAKELVQQMNGTIGVNSQPNRGANFWFTIQAHLAQKPEPLETFEPLKGCNIALFDKHPLVRMSLTQLLTEWKASPCSAGKIELLEELIESKNLDEPFDAVILSVDFNVTDTNDYDRILEKLESIHRCPTLLLHYTLEDGEYQTKLADKVTYALAKPIRYRELHQVLAKMVGASPHYSADSSGTIWDAPILFETPPKVLVVDDNQANLKLVSTLLGEIGAEVTEATSGLQSLEHLNQESFDLIYMDIQMPGMDGVEVTRRIRRNPSSYRDVPIVALTAHALASEKSELLKNGMDDYLSKPVTEQQLVDTILRWTDIELKSSRDATPIVESKEDTALVEPFEPATVSSKKNIDNVVDIKSAIELAAGKEELAQELFGMLVDSLEQESMSIRQTHADEDHENLLKHVHRLHGATRYCGVPALKAAAENAEVTLKQQPIEQLDQAIQKLLHEIQRVMQWANANEWVNPA